MAWLVPSSSTPKTLIVIWKFESCLTSPDSFHSVNIWCKKNILSSSLDPKGNNIVIFVNDLQLNECGNKEKLSDPCLFLKRVFNGAVPIKMAGQISPKTLELEGYTSKEMVLGPNIVLRGLKNRKVESKNEKIQVKITVNDKTDQISLLGLLKFAGDTSKELLGKKLH